MILIAVMPIAANSLKQEMKRLFSIVFIFFTCTGFLFSQEQQAYVIDGQAYINYTVQRSEGMQSIANKFNTKPAAIAALNDLQTNAGLQESQLLKVPVSGILKSTCSGDNCTSVFYEVQKSEGLYRIGKNFGDTKVATLVNMNQLRSEAVSLGQKLLVGYLDFTLPETAQASAATLVADQPVPAVEPVGVVVGSVNKPANAEAIKASPEPVVTVSTTRSFFEDQYKSAGAEEKLLAATFKSESGWNDGKFYVLVNKIAAGTIVKLVNTASNIAIYAKVLGELPAIKSADKVGVRISNAGAKALGINEDQELEVSLQY